jgi:magnesium transporter
LKIAEMTRASEAPERTSGSSPEVHPGTLDTGATARQTRSETAKMFRTIRFKTAGLEVLDGPDSAVPPREGEMCWIDLQPPDDADLKLMQKRFGFHPLAIEDCAAEIHRAKVDEYGNHLFLVTHSMRVTERGRHGIATSELDVFLGDRYLITIHREPIPGLEIVWKRASGDATCGTNGMDFICYLIVDELVDEVFPLIDQVSDQLEDVESAILKRVESRQLQQLMRLKRWLISMRRVLSPERDMLAILLRRGDPRISERTALYFRDVYDHIVRAYEQIDVERDLLGNAMDAYLSMMANTSTIIMKQLTLLASIFLPLTFMTGFFGQNFNALPFDSKSLFYTEIGACIALPAVMFFWFRRSGWL